MSPTSTLSDATPTTPSTPSTPSTPTETTTPTEPITPYANRQHGRFAERDRRAEQLLSQLTELGTAPDADAPLPKTAKARAARAKTDAQRQAIVDELVRLHLDLCDGIAGRYSGRSIPTEDLVQVARLALVVAIRRYQPGPGTSFIGYALPTISGELKRHFRDHGWMVRPPRRLQELGPVLRSTRERWEQQHGTEPTIDELADEIGVSTAEIDECLAAEQSYHPLSLDLTFDDDESRPLAEHLAEPHTALESSVDRVCLLQALGHLSPKERALLRMRFVDDLTQKQIGVALGVSQMQVSRLVRAVLIRLRTLMGVPDNPEMPVAS